MNAFTFGRVNIRRNVLGYFFPICPFIPEAIFSFLSHDLTLIPKMECSDSIMAHFNVELLGSSNPPKSASPEAGITHACLSFLIKNKKSKISF